jgi:ABC-type glycerol-3-phosphate transport system substrate-binding protein
MPIGIQAYTMYNMLSYAAPELRGLWEMVPVPGTLMSDGTINRAETSNVSGCILMKDANDPEAAFTFLEWWTSAEIQAQYGNDLESIMGPAARYNPANIKAFEMLPWNRQERETIMAQWVHVTDVPQIPGNYYIYRSLSNAFRSVVDYRRFPRGEFKRFNEEMNREITRKRLEFGLD